MPGTPTEGARYSDRRCQVLRKIARSAWCYGDPGIAAALLVAGQCAGAAGQPWIDEARDLALGAARRPLADAGVVDAGLCHGGAGLGHLFNRLYQATGEDALRDAARHWLRWTLDARDEHAPAGMVRFRGVTYEGGRNRPTWIAEPGFLTGNAGVALALLAAVSDVDPAWDRVLLASSTVEVPRPPVVDR